MAVQRGEGAVAGAPLRLQLLCVLLPLAEQRDPEPCDGDRRLHLVLLEKHPLEGTGPGERVVGEVWRAVAEVPEDRVRLGEELAVVQLERRHAQRRVLPAEKLGPVRAVEDVDLDPLVPDPAQREDLAHLPAVAGELRVVEPHSSRNAGSGWRLPPRAAVRSRVWRRQLLEVEGHAVELHRRRLDDRIRGPRVEAEVVLGLEVVVAEPDAARVDVPGRSDPPELRDVDVTAGQQVGAGAGEGIRRVLGENDGVVVRRRRVEAEQPQAVEVDLDRRLERAQVLDVLRRELREAPLALRQLSVRRDLGARRPDRAGRRRSSPAPRGLPRCAGARGTRSAAARPVPCLRGRRRGRRGAARCRRARRAARLRSRASPRSGRRALA